jgi:hypothetical protein
LVARLDEETSNQIFEVFEEWSAYLEHQDIDDFLGPPCP